MVDVDGLFKATKKGPTVDSMLKTEEVRKILGITICYS